MRISAVCFGERRRAGAKNRVKSDYCASSAEAVIVVLAPEWTDDVKMSLVYLEELDFFLNRWRNKKKMITNIIGLERAHSITPEEE